MAFTTPSFLANGNIQPCCPVKLDRTSASTSHMVIQAAAVTDQLIGISQEGSHDAPGVGSGTALAAKQGQQLVVYGPGEECLVYAVGAITQGDELIYATETGPTGSDYAGVTLVGVSTGTLSGTLQYSIGQALETAADGTKFRMTVRPKVLPLS